MMLKYLPQNYRFLCKEKKNLCFFLSKYQQHYRNSTSYQILFSVFPMTRTSFFFPLPEFGQFVSFHSFTAPLKKKNYEDLEC